jgi:beta-lactamase class A
MPLPPPDADLLRRRLLAGALAAPALLLVPRIGAAGKAPVSGRAQAFVHRLEALEAAHGGRLGVAALEVATGQCYSRRGDERFLMCSTFKVPAVALVLDRVQRGRESLSRAVPVEAADLVTYSPVTERHVGRTMRIDALCEAALTVSDNTAGNLLLRSFGGPAALTAWMRQVGDDTTRLDRIEVELNRPEPSGLLDTTTPKAMARLCARLLFGVVLHPGHRRRLSAWMAASQTGFARLRAGVPAGWAIGDKTGTGPVTTNDVAWVRPHGGEPWVVAVYYGHAPHPVETQNTVIAEVGKAFAHLLAANA